MRDPSIKSYSPPLAVGKPVDNGGVAEVVSSDSPDFKKGDIVYGWLGSENYSAIPKETLARFRKIENKYNLPLSNYTGVSFYRENYPDINADKGSFSRRWECQV
jgi:NADPH-dependent curcumin reductase CurA